MNSVLSDNWLIVIAIPVVIGLGVGLAIYLNRKINNYNEKTSEIEQKIDNTTVYLLYILSFFIPLAGFIVGAIYASKNEEHYKHVGKTCLIFSVLNIALGFIMIAVILGSI